MPIVKCTWCGKQITRKGKKALEAKYHYCCPECKSNVIRENNPMDRYKTIQYQTRCTLCGDMTIFHSLNGRYCPKCKPLMSEYLRRIRKGQTYENIYDYMRFIIDGKFKHKKQAKYVIKQQKANL